MTQSSEGSWEATRRELREMAIAVLLLDTIPIGLGGLIARTLGREMWVVGAGLAVWVTICFAVLIGGNVAIEYAIERRALRRGRRSGGTL